MRLIAAFMAVAAVALMPAGADAAWPTNGGDGGTIIHVTSLADSGPGTLRAALAASGPRRIVFNVGGEIFLKGPMKIYEPAVTIAGETAPAPGITLLGDKLEIRTSDVIVRSIRIRVGELPGSYPANRDGISIEPNKDKPAARILIDRCSVAWAIDENIGLSGTGVSDVLIRNTIIAEGLRYSIHPKGIHSMGMLVGTGSLNIVVEGNLFISNNYRNPVIDAGSTAVVLNNLIYDPGRGGFQIYRKADAGPTLATVVGNVLIGGPSTSTKPLRSFSQGLDPGSKIYYRDNVTSDARAFSRAELAGDPAADPVPFVTSPPIWFAWIEPLPSRDVEKSVLALVGPRPLDKTDKQFLAEVRAHVGAIRDTPGDPRLRVTRPL